jgi:hypothetical protein
MRDGHGDQLFGLRGERTFSEHSLAEGSESVSWPGGQTDSLLSELSGWLRIELLVFGHGQILFDRVDFDRIE